ncbi:hypothetical protein NM208_g4937 [Fusarium decemcellulare]|uniref:Uncharacterized protein n=1 Tax=Fusarium decemcellulare TaxID=57161 RepID=A0ACC1SIY5_9HYPO|nr:hypothetical protein NM208_g4937 [Fusarium decemcellulare]
MTRNRQGNRRGNRRGDREGNHSDNHSRSMSDRLDAALDEIIAGSRTHSDDTSNNPFSSNSTDSTHTRSSVHHLHAHPTVYGGSMQVATPSWLNHITAVGRTQEQPVVTFFDTYHRVHFVLSWIRLPVGWTYSDFHSQFTTALPHINRLATDAGYRQTKPPYSLILTDQGPVLVHSINMSTLEFEAFGVLWAHSDLVRIHLFSMTFNACGENQYVQLWQYGQVTDARDRHKIRISFNLLSRGITVAYM